VPRQIEARQMQRGEHVRMRALFQFAAAIVLNRADCDSFSDPWKFASRAVLENRVPAKQQEARPRCSRPARARIRTLNRHAAAHCARTIGRAALCVLERLAQ